MNTLQNQHGVGLMEILVALLILAIGVLGFIALQYRAIEATTESSYRVQALNIARDMAERIRVNRSALADYNNKLAEPVANQIVTNKNCAATNCTNAELAEFDVSQVAKKAQENGMVINRVGCQGNNDNRSCIYVAWGDTAPTNGDSGDGNCTTGASYDPASTCLIMEVY